MSLYLIGKPRDKPLAYITDGMRVRKEKSDTKIVKTDSKKIHFHPEFQGVAVAYTGNVAIGELIFDHLNLIRPLLQAHQKLDYASFVHDSFNPGKNAQVGMDLVYRADRAVKRMVRKRVLILVQPLLAYLQQLAESHLPQE